MTEFLIFLAVLVPSLLGVVLLFQSANKAETKPKSKGGQTNG